MAWQINGIGKMYQQAAEEAAARAGLSLGEWLDRVVLAHPAGPTRADADAEITKALAALENRIEQSDQRLGEIIKPLSAEVERLETESRALREGHSGAAEELAARLARLEASEKPEPVRVEDPPSPARPAPEPKPEKERETAKRAEPAQERADPPFAAKQRNETRDEPERKEPERKSEQRPVEKVPEFTLGEPPVRRSAQKPMPVPSLFADADDRGPRHKAAPLVNWDRPDAAERIHLPNMKIIRRRRLVRMVGGFGAMVLVVGCVAAGVWLWLDHEKLPEQNAAALPGLTTPSTDQTPPRVIGEAQPDSSSPPTPQSAASIAMLRDRAQNHDPQAEYELGLALLHGNGITPNPREAGEWIAAAALNGHPGAQLELGKMYGSGKGYTRDPQQAFFWISSAAEQKNTEAEYELGMLYTRGDGIARSHALAAQWFRKAADKNYGPALYQLGLIYELGLDYRANAGRALGWYRRAAAAGYEPARQKVTALESKGVRAAATPARPIPPASTPAPATAETTAAPPPAAPTPPAAPASELNKAEIAEIQRLLTELALDPGPADGVLGEKTVAAIQLYQQMGGMQADGKPTRQLLLQMREVAGNAQTP